MMGLDRGLRRFGFTLTEALLAVAVSSVACTAVVLTLGHSQMQHDDQVVRTLALGLARDMMEEIASQRLYDPDPDPIVGIEPDEQIADPQPQTREPFDDIDDYDGWERQPPEDAGGTAMVNDPTGATTGGGLARYADFRRRVRVQYVRLDQHDQLAPSDWTADRSPLAAHVTVEVQYRGRLVCELHKLFTFDEQY